MTRFHVIAHLDQATSVQEASKLFEGLYRLSAQGEISLRLHAAKERAAYPRVVRLTVVQEGATREIAIDLSDQAWLVHLPDLERADLYFKRSLLPEQLTHLPETSLKKIQPFGLNNPALSVRAARRLLVARRASGVSLRQLAIDARQLLALPSPSAFECRPSVAAEPMILFQTRLWEPNGDPLTMAINQERAVLVRELAKAFGRRFIGGIIPSAYARNHFPETLTTLDTGMRAYARLLKRPLIAVYTRGLHNSVGFKMGEYLAASRAVVGHRPVAALPRALKEGSNYLPFGSADECLAQCDRLLTDPELAAEMRRSNWGYYLDQVEPAAQLMKSIEHAFESERS